MALQQSSCRAKGEAGVLDAQQIRRLTVVMHACMRNVLASVTVSAEDITDSQMQLVWDFCIARALDHCYGEHERCNHPPAALRAICTDAVGVTWCHYDMLQPRDDGAAAQPVRFRHLMQTCSCAVPM